MELDGRPTELIYLVAVIVHMIMDATGMSRTWWILGRSAPGPSRLLRTLRSSSTKTKPAHRSTQLLERSDRVGTVETFGCLDQAVSVKATVSSMARTRMVEAPFCPRTEKGLSGPRDRPASPKHLGASDWPVKTKEGQRRRKSWWKPHHEIDDIQHSTELRFTIL